MMTRCFEMPPAFSSKTRGITRNRPPMVRGIGTLREDAFDAVLLDVNLGGKAGSMCWTKSSQLPQMPVLMFTAQGTVKTAVEAMRRGALDFLEKPFTPNNYTGVARLQRFSQMNQSIQRLEREVKETQSQTPELLLDFTTPVMQEIMAVLDRAAKTPASILITGESGTGKSVLARVVHEQSHLADKPFITVSCPSLSKELLESELFGHVKGSFTGAIKDHWGKVKAASAGRCFWMKLAICQWRYNRNCCGCCRKGNMNVWERTSPARRSCASCRDQPGFEKTYDGRGLS